MVGSNLLTLFVLCVLICPLLGKKGFGPGDQEWGYVTVRPKAHMFWWLYYTTADVNLKYEEKPLVIWLQGGPGVSGVAYGNFEELGPLDARLKPRNHTWVKDYNVVFIDNPVGTGFSYVESRDVFSENNTQIAADLMQCIKEFFIMFPRFSKTPTYILAESYGGKMTVQFANLWNQEQVKGNIKSNLKGIGLIDSFISAEEMYKSMGPYLFNLGMIDRIGLYEINKAAFEFEFENSIGNWLTAVDISNEIEYLIQKFTYSVDRFNVLTKVEPAYLPMRRSLSRSYFQYSKDVLNVMSEVKNVLALKSEFGTQESSVYVALLEDCRRSVVNEVEKLLNETDIKVFVLNGQLDIVINTPGVLSWVEKLKWKHSEDWFKAPRKPLVVNNIIEGFSKGFGNLKFYWISRSGHMIPADNPVAMGAALKELIYD